MNQADITAFAARLQTQMEGQLSDISRDTTDMLTRSVLSVKVTASHIISLKNFVRSYEFGAQDEIKFFKHLKPAFMSVHYYHEMLGSLLKNVPFDAAAESRQYFRDKLAVTSTQYQADADLFSYWMAGNTHLDDYYFKRGFVPETDVHVDREFSTGYDEKISRLLALRMIRDFIYATLEDKEITASTLTWTGSKADFIELIYALDTVGVINKGKADIRELAEKLGKLFNIEVTNYYRQFLDIRLRKKEKAIFLTQLKTKLEERINEFV